jgi:ABC-type transporter Mla MlaB component
MLFISKPEMDEHRVTLRLEGQIVGPWVEELRRASEKLLGNGHRLTLDLTEVTFADSAGVALLLSLREKVISLTGCSSFIEEQLRKPS